MQKEDIKIIITPEHKLFDFHLKEVIEYKDLIFLFVKRDFSTNYKQTILGYAWAIIQPLLTTVFFTVIFGNLAELSTLDSLDNYLIPSFLFYMAGNICWSYFSGTVSSTSATFINNSDTMTKVYYPRIIAPIATTIYHLFSLFVQLAFLLLLFIIYYFCGGYDIYFTLKLLLIPLIIVQLAILSAGCGIIISSLTTKYRDLNMLVGFGLQLWQYVTPIAYGLSLVINKMGNYLYLYMINPLSPIITTFRYAVFGVGYFNLSLYLLSWLETIIIFVVGLIMFSKVERNFMDTI